MGRTIPVINETPSDHRLLSLSLLLACMAAVIVVTSAMCGTWSRKKRNARQDANKNKVEDALAPPSPQDRHETLVSTSTNDVLPTETPPPPTLTTPPETMPATTMTPTPTSPIGSEGEAVNKPLPPPPAAIAIDSGPILDPMKKRKPNIDKSSSLHNYISKKPTRRKLSAGNISLRMHGGLSIKHKEHERGEDHSHKRIRSTHEESLWTKKILLGEKCRLHEEDEEKGKEVYSEEMGMLTSSSSDEDTTSSLGEVSFKEKETERSTNAIPEQV